MPNFVLAARHAKPKKTTYEEDPPLSEEGILIEEKVAKLLVKENINIDVIYTSPLLRARQSAEIIAQYIPAPIFVENTLGEGFDKNVLLELILFSKEKSMTTCFMGHAPTMAEFVNDLTGFNALPNGLDKSSIALLEFPNEIAFHKGKLKKNFP
ncbi:MAG: phosphoglycerate mutase family protein [Chlamydiota bacterium]|jgi:phosphohistidine phosphatase